MLYMDAGYSEGGNLLSRLDYLLIKRLRLHMGAGVYSPGGPPAEGNQPLVEAKMLVYKAKQSNAMQSKAKQSKLLAEGD